ncbi:8322_t:CDS:2 [Gigaspora rosea]|nr:8322_t:CDS:2 [Gigaspora rosea]
MSWYIFGQNFAVDYHNTAGIVDFVRILLSQRIVVGPSLSFSS